MRALGIPNTSHFHLLTKIADVQKQWEKLRAEGAGAGWKEEEGEELEDSEGNVFSKRDYLALKAQGLV